MSFQKPEYKPGKIYLMMNKPAGYVCSAVSDSHKTIYELLPPELQALVQNAKRGERLHTVGRLDCESKGLLLITNDGHFSDYLTRPQHKIPKLYEVLLEKAVDPASQQAYKNQLAKGLVLPPEKKAPAQSCEGAQLHFLSSEVCQVTVTEGKFHEVRRIFMALGNKVKELTRISIGPYKLPETLASGDYQPLSPIL